MYNTHLAIITRHCYSDEICEECVRWIPWRQRRFANVEITKIAI